MDLEPNQLVLFDETITATFLRAIDGRQAVIDTGAGTIVVDRTRLQPVA